MHVFDPVSVSNCDEKAQKKLFIKYKAKKRIYTNNKKI